jgi:TPR repeat protein
MSNGFFSPVNSSQDQKGIQLPASFFAQIQEIKKKAVAGEPDAINEWGWIRLLGLDGKAASVQDAIEQFERAHELYEPTATFNLGWCYENGIGKPKDVARAFEYYYLAANYERNPKKVSLYPLLHLMWSIKLSGEAKLEQKEFANYQLCIDNFRRAGGKKEIEEAENYLNGLRYYFGHSNQVIDEKKGLNCFKNAGKNGLAIIQALHTNPSLEGLLRNASNAPKTIPTPK